MAAKRGQVNPNPYPNHNPNSIINPYSVLNPNPYPILNPNPYSPNPNPNPKLLQNGGRYHQSIDIDLLAFNCHTRLICHVATDVILSSITLRASDIKCSSPSSPISLSLIQAPTQLPSHSMIHLLIHSITYSPDHLLIQTTCSFTQLPTHLITCSLKPLAHSLNHLIT
jgi:hypothetical protein